uniref:Uncharacterized protein n=1 Tax=Arundo donax TaxID=35708 RepID=A0A0A9GD95_ARUDO
MSLTLCNMNCAGIHGLRTCTTCGFTNIISCQVNSSIPKHGEDYIFLLLRLKVKVPHGSACGIQCAEPYRLHISNFALKGDPADIIIAS